MKSQLGEWEKKQKAGNECERIISTKTADSVWQQTNMLIVFHRDKVSIHRPHLFSCVIFSSPTYS